MIAGILIRPLLAVLFLFGQQQPPAKVTRYEFQILHSNKVIGTVTAVKVVKGNMIIEDLHTVTKSKALMMEVHVESEINLNYREKALVNGVAYRIASRSKENVECKVVRTGRSYNVVRNGKKRTIKAERIDFCVVDLYFNEPLNRKFVFSTMYGQFVSLITEGKGRYRTDLPDKKKAVYTYKSGRLETVEVEMVIGKVVTRRKE